MNENELYVVKECKFDNPLFNKIDSIIDSCYRECHNKYFHTFEYEWIYDIKLTNITNNDVINLTIMGKSMNLYALNKTLTVARQNGFIFNQINELTIKLCSTLSNIIIHYYLQHRIPIMPCHFLRKLAQNPEFFQTFCNGRRNPFLFACCKRYLFNNPQCC